MKYKCVIFDCDGVLVDSETITCRVLVEMIGELGIPMNFEFAVQNFLGKSLNGIMQHLDMLMDKSLPASFESEYRNKTFEAFKKELKPIAGVHDLLDKLHIPYCVASSGPLNKIQHNLAITGLAERFQGKMFSCYEINSWKPNPHIFLHAAEVMGFEPDECVVIEDSLIGVQAARAGGFDVYMYSNGQQNDQVGLEGVNIFDDMTELDILLSL